MRTLHSARIALIPVDLRNARELWEVLNAPDLRKFQDIPRVRAEEFERQVRARQPVSLAMARVYEILATGVGSWQRKAGAA